MKAEEAAAWNRKYAPSSTHAALTDDMYAIIRMLLVFSRRDETHISKALALDLIGNALVVEMTPARAKR